MLMIYGPPDRFLTPHTLYGRVISALNPNALPFAALVVCEVGA
jgi:hypothetical protein